MTQTSRKRKPSQEQHPRQTDRQEDSRQKEKRSSRRPTSNKASRGTKTSDETSGQKSRKASEPQAERPRRRRTEQPDRRQPGEPERRRAEQGKRQPGKPERRRAVQGKRQTGEPERHRTKRRKPSREQAARARKLGSSRRVGVVATGVLLACAAVVGLLFFARPSVSKVENRALTPFPALSWDSFWSGSFFSDLALWYSDTYPLREQMVAADQTLDGLHGIKTETQMVGGTKQADELPPIDQSSGESDSSSSSSADQAEDAKTKRENVEVPTAQEVAAAVQSQITDGLYVKGDAAYNAYYFSQEAVDDYADAINTFANEVKGQATVYSVLVPTSSGVMLSEEEEKSIGGTNQADATDYFFSKYNESVRDVDVIGNLKKHTDEYVYFRTDHHWTDLGAYYGYEAFCSKKGIEPVSRDKKKYKNMGDFLGSFYSQLNSEAMAANPDYMEAWYPNATNELTLYDTDGSAEKYEIITDNSSLDPLGKSMTFIMGDQPLEKISNPDLSDGSSCLVIKDSFGDEFSPWLVDNYQTVWIADFRYFEGSFLDLIKENDIKDVIFVNSISLAGGGVVAPSILGKL